MLQKTLNKLHKKYTINYKTFNMTTLALSTFLFLINFVFEAPFNVIVLGVATITALFIPMRNGISKLNKKCYFNMNFMVSLAVIYLFIVGEVYQSCCAAIINLLTNYVINFVFSSDIGIPELLEEISNHEYHCYINREDVTVKSDVINSGDMVEVTAGEYIPVDGIVKAGSGTLDNFSITGNNKIVTKYTNDVVMSGSLLLTGSLIVLADASVQNSSIGKTVNIITKTDKRTKNQKVTSIILNVISALIIVGILINILVSFLNSHNFDVFKYGIPLLFIASSLEVLYEAVSISFDVIVKKAAKLGIVISSKEFLEKTMSVKTVLFSTLGVLSSKLPQIVSIESTNGATEEDVIKYAAYSQCRCDTAISHTLCSHSKDKIRNYNIISFEPYGANGSKTVITGNHEIVTGSSLELEQLGIATGEVSDTSKLCVAVNKIYIGCIKFESEVKTDVRRCVENLKEMGVKEVVILSSQSEATVNDIMMKSGIDKFYPVNDQESFNEILKKYKKNSLLYSFGMDNFDSNGNISEVKYDGYNNFAEGDCITIVDDLSAPVNHLLLISNLKSLFIQNIALFVLLEIFVAAATLSHYANVWQVVLIIGAAKVLTKYLSNKNIGKI